MTKILEIMLCQILIFMWPFGALITGVELLGGGLHENRLDSKRM